MLIPHHTDKKLKELGKFAQQKMKVSPEKRSFLSDLDEVLSSSEDGSKRVWTDKNIK